MRRKLYISISFMMMTLVFADEKELARLYLEEAVSFLETDNTEKAEKLMADAGDFYPHASDLFSMRADNMMTDGMFFDACSEYRQAFALNDWLIPDNREKADSGYLQTLFTIGRYTEFVDYYKNLSPFMQNREELLTKYLFIQYSEGNNLYDTVSRLLYTYPENEYLTSIMFETLFRKFGTELDLSLFPDNQILVESALSFWLREGLDAETIARNFILLFPVDKYSSLFLKLLNHEIPEWEEISVFLNGNYDRYKMAETLVGQFASLDTNEMNAHRSGEYFRDSNGDRIKDEWFRLLDGDIVYRKTDRNQDGIIDLEITYKDNEQPVSAGNRLYKIEYSSYPLVSRIEMYDSGIRQEYIMNKKEYSLDINSLGSKWTGEYKPFKEIFDSTLVMRESNSDNVVLSETCFENGYPVFFTEDTDANGTFDHQLILEDYTIKAGRRDLDEDGLYELYEYFESGFFKGMALDSDSDKQADYWKQFSPLILEFWDYNRDFFIDRGSRMIQDSIRLDFGIIEKTELTPEEVLQWNMSNRTGWFIN